MTMRRLILAGESRPFHEALTLLLESEALTIVGTVAGFAELLPLLPGVAGREPDLILRDQPENAAQDLDVMKVVTAEFPQIGLIVLANHGSVAQLDMAIECGARGFLPKDISPAALSLALQLIALGENLFAAPASLSRSQRAADEIPPVVETQELRIPLSTRECVILQCLEAGSPNKVIARKLDIAKATVKVHLKSVLRKINVGNRTQAAVWAMNHRPSLLNLQAQRESPYDAA
jgi:two-component system nitrate/nitrite response regulator NarL